MGFGLGLVEGVCTVYAGNDFTNSVLEHCNATQISPRLTEYLCYSHPTMIGTFRMVNGRMDA
jgi:hypothetical protein